MRKQLGCLCVRVCVCVNRKILQCADGWLFSLNMNFLLPDVAWKIVVRWRRGAPNILENL